MRCLFFLIPFLTIFTRTHLCSTENNSLCTNKQCQKTQQEQKKHIEILEQEIENKKQLVKDMADSYRRYKHIVHITLKRTQQELGVAAANSQYETDKEQHRPTE